ncbi:MAG TPA: hypothetical protein VIJ35_02660 [Bradyrhizobium sp.]
MRSAACFDRRFAGSPEDMQRYVLAETEKWGKVAKFAGIKPE